MVMPIFELVKTLNIAHPLPSPDFNAANCSGLILIILGVLLPDAIC